MARPTIDDIARIAGVSRGAVSFALNDRPGVSAETRARILRVADEMNWRPHKAAQALGGARADAVGLVVAHSVESVGTEPFFGILLAGLQSELSAHSIALHLMIVESLDAEIEIYRRWTSEHRIDGFVVINLQVHDPRIKVLESLDMPAVVVGGPGGHGSLPNVWADDREAMLSLVDYLATLGHRRIAHVAGAPTYRHTQRRMRALQDAAKRLDLIEAVSVPTDFSDAEGASATRALLARPHRPTALIFDSDVMAVAGLGVAAEMNVAVPDDISVVSFDDSVLTRIVHPPLTAMSRDTFAFAAKIAETVIATLAAPGTVRGVKTPTPRLVVRESTRPLTVPPSATRPRRKRRPAADSGADSAADSGAAIVDG